MLIRFLHQINLSAQPLARKPAFGNTSFVDIPEPQVPSRMIICLISNSPILEWESLELLVKSASDLSDTAKRFFARPFPEQY